MVPFSSSVAMLSCCSVLSLSKVTVGLVDLWFFLLWLRCPLYWLRTLGGCIVTVPWGLGSDWHSSCGGLGWAWFALVRRMQCAQRLQDLLFCCFGWHCMHCQLCHAVHLLCLLLLLASLHSRGLFYWCICHWESFCCCVLWWLFCLWMWSCILHQIVVLPIAAMWCQGLEKYGQCRLPEVSLVIPIWLYVLLTLCLDWVSRL